MTKKSKPYKPDYLFNIDDNSFMALCKDNLNQYSIRLMYGDVLSMNFGNYEDSYQEHTVYTDRETLKRMAEFILKYLENN